MNEKKAENYTNGIQLTVDALKLNGVTTISGICPTVSAPGFLNGMVALANATTNCFPIIQISGSSDRGIVDLQRGDYEEHQDGPALACG